MNKMVVNLYGDEINVWMAIFVECLSVNNNYVYNVFYRLYLVISYDATKEHFVVVVTKICVWKEE